MLHADELINCKNFDEVFASGDLDKILFALLGGKSTKELKKGRNIKIIVGIIALLSLFILPLLLLNKANNNNL